MSLTKLEVMKQKTLGDLLVRLVENAPGITTTKLFTTAKDWGGDRVSTYEFEQHMKQLREKGYRVTNKQWYPSNHEAKTKVSAPPQVSPQADKVGVLT